MLWLTLKFGSLRTHDEHSPSTPSIPCSVGTKNCSQISSRIVFMINTQSLIESRYLCFLSAFSFDLTCQNPRDKIITVFITGRGTVHALKVMCSTVSHLPRSQLITKTILKFETPILRGIRKQSFPASADSSGKDNFFFLCYKGYSKMVVISADIEFKSAFNTDL